MYSWVIIFQIFNNYIKRNCGKIQEALCVDKLIQGLQLHKKDDYEDEFYVYCTLLDALKYGASKKESVGMHIIDDTF